MGFDRADTNRSPAAGGRRRPLRPGRLDLYLLRGVAGPLALLLVAIAVALLLERALRLIHELAALGADIGYLPAILLHLVPYYLELAIPLAFMVALVLLVARLDERLELEAMLASGLSLWRIAAPLVALGWVLAGFALLAGGWLEPHGRYGYRALKIEAADAGRLAALQPRALFQPSADLAVTYDERAPDGTMRGIFLWQRLAGGEELVVSGGAGRVGFSPREGLFGIDFAAGRYTAEQAGDEPYTLDFRDLAFRETMRREDSTWQRGWDPKELTLPELLAEARTGASGYSHRAIEVEFYGRIARALLIPVIPLLVVPLAFATKKRGRTLGVVLCAAFVAVSRHLLSFAINLAEAGAASPPRLLLGTIGALALVVLALFASARKLPSHSPLHSLLDPIARAGARLAPKTRVVPGLRGHSLTGYVLWEVGKWTLLATFTIALFLQMIDLIEQGGAFVSRGFGPAEIGRYAWLKLPAIVQQAAPIGALAGAMAAFALFAGRREMTAMRAAGVSQWRVLAKAAPVAVIGLAAIFALAEWATPASQVRLATWWAQTEPAASDDRPEARWFRIGGDIVKADTPSADGTRLSNVRLYQRDAQGRLERRIAAARAVRRDGGWQLRDVQVTRYGSDGIVRTQAARQDWEVPLRGEDVAAFFSQAPALSAAAARRTLAQEAPLSRAEMLFATRVHRSAAEPLAPLAMLLFALPLAFIPPRTGRSWPAVLYAGGAGLLYLVGDGVLTVAAQVGYVPPLLGAWAAPVLAILVGLTVLVYSER
ncbi:MAG TPA: LptF/LptG family permease [Croceibacterium sp.]|nr:LptF/LptG family permease [Croceibacterium sp.]